MPGITDLLLPAGLGALLGGALAGGTGQDETSIQTTQVQLPPWLEGHYQNLLDRTKALSEEPYFGHPGPRVSEFTPDQLASFGLGREASQAYRPLVEEGIGQLGGISTDIYGSPDVQGAIQGFGSLPSAVTAPRAQGAVEAGIAGLEGIPTEFTPELAQQYMSPFTQAVKDQAFADIQRQGDIQEQRIGDEVIRTGNFGGSRAGIRLSELDRNVADTMARTGADLDQASFAQAQQQFERDRGAQFGQAQGLTGIAGILGADRAAQLQGLSGIIGSQGIAQGDRAAQFGLSQGYTGIGGIAQQLGLTGAQALGAQGLQQQNLEQQNLNVGYQDFLEQRQYPYNQAQFYQSSIQGTPAPTSSTAQTSVPGPDPFTQVAGLGIAGLGLYNNFAG